ncbi:proline-rich protein 36-like isoform X2 [Alligator mississippiensis]|uniref:proline-rich protein 36-like isoform X2 n=1 Tax=Alligator mississippiensis TaxID=8496 RepID=UPI0009071555|nr:proline-rich protein 36-like isoform X2 [Alligator mississippiensis]
MQEKFPVFLLIAAGLLGLSEDDPAEVTFPFQTLAADPARGAAASFSAARAEMAEKGTDQLLEESSRNSDGSEQLEGAMLNAQTSGFFTSMSSPVLRQKTESWVVQDPNEPLLGKAARGEHAPAPRPGTASASMVQSRPSGPRASQPLRSAFAGSVPPDGIQETAVPSARASPVTRAVESHVLVQSPKEPSVPAVNATQAPAGLGGDRFPALGPSSDRLGESSPQVRLDLASVTLAAPKETPGLGARVTPVAFLQKPVSGGLAAIVSRAKQLAPVGLSPPKRATTESQTTLPATSELSTPGSPDGLSALLAPPPGDAPPSFIPGPPEVPAPQASSQSLHKLRSRTDEPRLTSVTRPVPLGELGLSTAGRKSRVERPTLALPRGIGRQTSACGPEPARSPESSKAAAGRPSPLTQPQARALLSQPVAAGRAGTSLASPRRGQLSSATLVAVGSPPLNSADSPRPSGTAAPAHLGLPAPLLSASTAPGLALLRDPDETAKPLAQGLLNNSSVTSTRNLSAFLAEHLLLPASAQYLTFLVRSADDALCLHPMPNAPPLTADLNATLQEVLPSSAALLSSALDPTSLKQLSPSSIILVKPLFVFLPADKPALSILPASAEEDRLATAFSFASQQDRGPATPSSGHGILKEVSSSSSTSEAPGAAAALSPAPDQLQRQAASPPVLAAFSTSTRAISLFGSQTFTSKHVPYPLGELGMTAPPSRPENQSEGAALPAASAPEENETSSLVPRGAFAEHLSVAPPALSLPTLHSPQMSTETLPVAANLSTPTIISPLPAKGFSGSPSPTSAPHTESRVTGWLQLISKLTLQSGPPHLGSVTVSALDKQRLAFSVGSTNFLPEVRTSLVPLQSSQSLGKPPSQTESRPSPALASSALSAGSNRTDLAASNDTPSEEVTARHAATPTPAASTKADLSKPAGFLPIPPNPFRTTEKPALASGPASFSTETQTNATVSGTPLGTSTQTPRQSRSSAGMSLYVSTSVPSSSTLKSSLASLEVAGGLSSLVNLGEEAKPTESVVVISSARREGSKELLGTTISLPAVPSPETQLSTAVILGLKLVPASARPPLSARPTTLQQDRELASGSVHPPSSRSPFAVINDQVTALLTSRKASLPMTSSSRSDLLPAVTTSDEAMTASPSPGEARGRPVTEGGVTAGHLPAQAPVSLLPDLPSGRPSHLPETASLGETGKLLGRFDLSTRLAQSTASATTVGTSASVATQLASTSDKLIEKTASQFSVSNAAVSDGLETLLTTDLSQFQPTSETLSDPSEVPMVFTSERSRLLDVTGLESFERPALHTEAEQVARISDMTEDTAGDLTTAPMWLEAEPVALENRAAGQLDDALLDGFAVVSDDTCGSGNYTARMSLRPAAEMAPGAHSPLSSPETFLAVIALQSNGSRPALRIQACCVTPTSRTPGPEAVCCLFPRAGFEAGKPHRVAAAGSETTFPIPTRVPFDCRHIQWLHGGQSRAASFTIQLFQMLNHSVAYLHCELNVCLSSSPGCEQDCLEGTEAASQPSSRSSSGSPHNLVSVGPVRKVKSAFPSEPVEGPASIMIVPILLGSLTGLAVLGSVFVCLWLHHRRKTLSPGNPFLRATSGL